MPPLMISVRDAETRLSIAARASPDGNEVAAILAALKSMDLKNCILTADALHCHPAMAEAVLAAGDDYALKLRGNMGLCMPALKRHLKMPRPKGRSSFRKPGKRTMTASSAVGPASPTCRQMHRTYLD